MNSSRDITRLIEIMAALRTPGTGCPWDLAQSFETIVPFTIEEAYEVADAVARKDHHDLRDELGDLLFQVVFQARMAEEAGHFDFGGVVEAITEKMIRRHEHVFGDARGATVEEVADLWARVKAEEKTAKSARRAGPNGDPTPNRGGGGAAAGDGILDGVPLALPGLTRAVKLQSKAAAVGFDWNDPYLVLAKIREETDEVEAALGSGDRDAVDDEIGDLLFAVANLARHLRTDPEAAARRANDKFLRRFRYIEEQLARAGHDCSTATLAEMEALWTEAKQRETESRGLDHDVFGPVRSKDMNINDSKRLDRDAGGKPVSTCPHPAGPRES